MTNCQLIIVISPYLLYAYAILENDSSPVLCHVNSTTIGMLVVEVTKIDNPCSGVSLIISTWWKIESSNVYFSS